MSISDEASIGDHSIGKGEKGENVIVSAASYDSFPGKTPNFATYLYHAGVQRAREAQADSIKGSGEEENDRIADYTEQDSPEGIERMQAKRALRTASWISVFFLVCHSQL